MGLLSFPASEDGRGRCAVASRCGGCKEIDSLPDMVRARKSAAIIEAFESIGCAPDSMEFFLEASPLGYRNRIRLRVLEDGTFGFFNDEKSPECIVLEPALRELLRRVRSRVESFPGIFSPYTHLELRSLDEDGVGGLFLGMRTTAPNRPVAGSLHERRLISALSGLPILVGGIDGRTMPCQRFILTDESYQYVPLDGFMQVNHTINRAMIAWLLRELKKRRVRRVVDLFCGSGNFIIPLLAMNYEGIGVENNESSVRSARLAILDQHLVGNVIAADVHDWARRAQGSFDVVVIDAPRAGLRDAVQHVASLRAAHVALFSCNVKSLLRDVAALNQFGYRASSLRSFDMFAHTDHVEVGVLLDF